MDKKSPDAFRTISEVAEWLGVPTHVLRFWESRFNQVKPVKRAGGRRYYRPSDMELLGGIRKLLHDDGMTIRGVQKLLREEGVKHVASLSKPLDGDDLVDVTPSNVVPLAPQPEPAKPEAEIEDAELAAEPETGDAEPAAAEPETGDAEPAAAAPESEPEPETPAAKAEPSAPEDDDLLASPEAMDFLAHDADFAPSETEADTSEPEPEAAPEDKAKAAPNPESTADAEPAAAPAEEAPAALDDTPALPDLPADPEDDDIAAPAPGLAVQLRALRSNADAAVDPKLGKLAKRLTALQEKMQASRNSRRMP